MNNIRSALPLAAFGLLGAASIDSAPAEAGNKVDICHVTGSGSYTVISVSPSAVSAHINNHGDAYAGTYYFTDADGDGYGDANGATSTCPDTGYVADSGDCNDGDATISPDAAEVCGDGVDNNCDGEVDEGCVVTCPCAQYWPTNLSPYLSSNYYFECYQNFDDSPNYTDLSSFEAVDLSTFAQVAAYSIDYGSYAECYFSDAASVSFTLTAEETAACGDLMDALTSAAGATCNTN